ncbi:MAG: AraC family transcriptional regulator [Acidobacteria bacterium]|nr:AraC family transcriptional regulator [Acidobacteriota bacterium]
MLLDKLLANLTVEVEPFALCQVSAGWRLRLPGPPKPLLHFVLQGVGAVLDPHDTAQPLAPLWLSVVPVGARHALECGGGVQNEVRIDAPPAGEPVCHFVAGTPDSAELVVACGLVNVRYGPSVSLFEHLRQVLAVDLSDRPGISAAFQAILAEQDQAGPGSTAMTAALMTECLVHLFRRLGTGPGGSLPWVTALEDPRLGRAIDRMLAKPAADHTVESLAETASMSRSAFAEHFTAAFGRSPMSLLQHIRMQQAAHLLRQESTLSVDDVAARVGYSSRSHFSEAFRKHHGTAPTAFRSAQA